MNRAFDHSRYLTSLEGALAKTDGFWCPAQPLNEQNVCRRMNATIRSMTPMETLLIAHRRRAALTTAAQMKDAIR